MNRNKLAMHIFCSKYEALRRTCVFLVALCTLAACSGPESDAPRTHSAPDTIPEPAAEPPAPGADTIARPAATTPLQPGDLYELARVVVQAEASNTSYPIDAKPAVIFGSKSIEEVREMFQKRIVQSQRIDKKFREFTAEDIDFMYYQEQKPVLSYWNAAMFGHNATSRDVSYSISIPLFSLDKQRAIVQVSATGAAGKLLVLYNKKKPGTAPEWSIQVADSWHQ